MDDALFQELSDSIREAGSILKGKKEAARTTTFNDVDIQSVRSKTGLSQNQFAALLGVSPSTLKNWEQGRRHPSGPAKALLHIVSAQPRMVLETLHADRLV